MDAFGIGAALQGTQQVYFRSARQTGRTTALLESLKPGDHVVCADAKSVARYKRLIEELGVKNIRLSVVAVNDPQSLFEKPTAEGRTVFDHTWLELFYTRQLEEATRFIDKLQREASGPGMAHVETRLAAREINMWRI
mgnify:CR=1 FL=1|jgi:hypothetical protein